MFNWPERCGVMRVIELCDDVTNPLRSLHATPQVLEELAQQQHWLHDWDEEWDHEEEYDEVRCDVWR